MNFSNWFCFLGAPLRPRVADVGPDPADQDGRHAVWVSGTQTAVDGTQEGDSAAHGKISTKGKVF